MQHAARFISMHDAELREAQRQIAVRQRTLLDDLRVPRTVHGFHRCTLALVRKREHVLAKVLPVPALFPDRATQELWSPDFLETGRDGPRTHRALERAVHGVAAGVPKHHAGRLFLEVKQIELLA